MKILHTSDWHLGQKFAFKDRQEEHDKALDFIYTTIIENEVEVLIVSGDIFDTSNPSNIARRSYYTFLSRLLNTCVRHIVIVGGNHDSPSMLEAPKDLLSILNIHIVATCSENLEDDVFCLTNKDGKTELIVAAIPFLRDRDIFQNLEIQETAATRSVRLKEGIKRHFDAVADYVKSLDISKDTPVICTGHLTVSGSENAENQDNIYIGNIENIDFAQFSNVFDYVALGHIHRAQSFGKDKNIRYSGSIIPLSFSEIQDKKLVYILDFEGKKIKKIQAISIPTYRKLLSIKGTLEQVFEQIDTLDQRLKLQLEESDKLKFWLDIVVESENMIPNLASQLNDFVKDKYVEIIKSRILFSKERLAEMETHYEPSLLENEESVFLKKCKSKGVSDEDQKELLLTFKELRESIV